MKGKSIIFSDEYLMSAIVRDVSVERETLEAFLTLLRYLDCRVSEFTYFLLTRGLGRFESKMISVSRVYKLPMRPDMFNFTESGVDFRWDLNTSYYLEDLLINETLRNVSRSAGIDGKVYIAMCRLIYTLYTDLLQSVKVVVRNKFCLSVVVGCVMLMNRRLVFLVDELCDSLILSDDF